MNSANKTLSEMRRATEPFDTGNSKKVNTRLSVMVRIGSFAAFNRAEAAFK